MTPGGSERVVLNLARSLDPACFEVYIASFKGGVLEASFREVCREIFIIQKRRRFDFSAMWQLAKVFREKNIDVVNAHHYMPCFYSFFGAKIFNRRKLIYTEHSVPEVEALSASIHGKVFSGMLSRIDAVVGVSKEIANTFKASYPRHDVKFQTIINGVDIGKFYVRGNREKIRSQWGFGLDHFVLGTVANFRRVKNHSCLVRAAARLKVSHPQLRLLFVGAGYQGDPENSEDEVRKLVTKLDLKHMVVFAGYQENIPEVLSACDGFCLPSFSEGLPVSVLEAMAARLPVIGSAVRGIAEVIENSKTGLLFNSDDDSGLAEAIKVLMELPEASQAMVARAYEYVKDNHDISVWANVCADIFY